MKNEKKYLYRIIIGIILWLSNNEFTWKTITYFSGINEKFYFLLSISNTVLSIVSLAGIIITFSNAIFLFELTSNER